MKKYEFNDNMKEISGFGGDYEKFCQNMVVAGLEWFDSHPDADPKYRGFKGIFGILDEDNPDAEALSAAMVSACQGCSGAMHQATVSHVLWIHSHSWKEYVYEMTKDKSLLPQPSRFDNIV